MKASDNLRRRKASRDPKRRFLIVCEGKVTEPRYFRRLCGLLRSLIELEIHSGGDPMRLVKRAAALKKAAEELAFRRGDSFLVYDQVWCVCDVDQHERLVDALQQAKAQDIHVAVSNPCFELWALLHFQEQTAHIERDKVQRLCRTHIPQYDKELPCELLEKHRPFAVARAQQLDRMQADKGTARGNPSTGVYWLVAALEAGSTC